MAYLSLYRKYRPQTFDEILGQDHVSTTLANAIRDDRVAHAYLFTGPRGTGKTSTARILAKALNCELGPTPTPCGKCASCVAIQDGSSMDVIEIDAASHSKVDETREILAGVPLASAGSNKKVYVIDEVHMLSAPSFNALLKTLEEPPSHVVFILATTEAHKVLATIVSRTQRFDFRRFGLDVLQGLLTEVAQKEGIAIDPAAVGALARHAEGSARDALSALEQLASFGDRITAEDAEGVLGERSGAALLILFDAVAAGDVGAVFSTINSLVAQGADVRQLALGTLEHARSLLLLGTAPDAEDLLDVSEEERATMLVQSERFSSAGLLRIVDLVAKALTEMRTAPNHRLLLELALVRSAAPETDPNATGLLGRIERLERRAGIEGAVEPAGPAPAAARPQSRAKTSQPTESAAPVKTRPEERAAPDAASKQEEAVAASDPEPAAPAPTTGVPAEVGLAHVRDAWPATLQELNKRSKRTWGMLNPSRPLDFDGQILTIEVQSDYHEHEMSEERNRALLADALYAALGIRPRLAFNARAGRSAAPESDADDSVDYSAPATVAETHDPVELVKKGLGAEVVEEKSNL